MLVFNIYQQCSRTRLIGCNYNSIIYYCVVIIFLVEFFDCEEIENVTACFCLEFGISINTWLQVKESFVVFGANMYVSVIEFE